MILTSITIGGSEYISKIDQENFTLVKETGGRIGTLTFDLYDTHSNIAAIAMGGAVIAYCGATKHFAGTLARVEPQLVNETYAVARCLCQDNNALLDSVTVPSETYTAQTDEAIIDDLFSTYLPAISTTAVVQVKASVTVTFTNKSLRQCLETLRGLTNAEFYVDADDKFQYYDGAAATANIIELQESPDVPIDHAPGNLNGWTSVRSDYVLSTERLEEDATAGATHYIHVPSSVVVVNGDYYVLSVDVKADERTDVALLTNISGGNQYAFFDIDAGTAGTAVGSPDTNIQEIGDGVFRCSIGVTAGAASGTFQVYLADGENTIYNGVSGQGVYLYAARVSTGVPFLLDGFTYTRDWQSRANSVTVVGLSTTSADEDPHTAATGTNEPGSFYSLDSGYPPPATGDGGYDVSADFDLANAYSGGQYGYRLAFLRFDTSAIPNDAVVTRARLELYVIDTNISDAFDLGIEWYAFDGSAWTTDYTTTPSNSAYGYLGLASIAYPAWASFELSTPTNVNKTGYTGFRLHPKRSSAPGGNNELILGDTGTTLPRLTVWWTLTSGISETRTDAVSIAAYGTFKRTIYDDKILTAAEAILRADVELDRCANPQEYGTIPFAADGIDRGDVVRIVSGVHGIDADFHLAALTIQWREGIQTNIGQYGLHQPDAIKRLRELSATS